jgi:hypothetical protein
MSVIYYTFQYPFVPKTPKTPIIQQLLSPRNEHIAHLA